MEFVTQIQWCINWFEKFKVNVDFLFLSFFCYNCTTVNNQAIWRYFVIKFESSLYRCNGSQDWKVVYSWLNVRCSSNSSANIFATREIWSLGGMINDIMLVPLLRVASQRRLSTISNFSNFFYLAFCDIIHSSFLLLMEDCWKSMNFAIS